jgi:hypothetical protein
MKRLLLVVCTLALGTLLPVVAHAEWVDGFESYAVGSSLHGQGGWIGWLNDPAATAYVSNLYAHGGSKSVAITGASDLVHQYTGYNTGTWTYTTWQYIPSNFTGQTYFILLNTYAAVNNWSTEVNFTNGLVGATSVPGSSLPLIYNQWVEIRVEINLDNDEQLFFYGGDLLYVSSWTAGASGGGGVLNIGAVDLYANGASPVYYDDMSLVSGSVATESTTWGSVKSLFR